MSYSLSKSIYIACSDSDRETATRLREALVGLLGEEVWMRDFDLNGGDVIAEEIANAAADAKWFIILVSASAVESRWLKFEADIATVHAIEDLGAKIIIVQLDHSELPKRLEVILRTQFTVDLTNISDSQDIFIRIAEYIEQQSSQLVRHEVYVDRGENTDEFSLLARRNKIVSVLGWPGIGKSSFVTESVSRELRKFPIAIKLTRGHSLDLLARQVIRKTHIKQPLNADALSDEQLLTRAIDAIGQRADKFFVFFDNTEEALGGSNELFPYLERFLEAFVESDITTHVVLATTRYPDYSAKLGQHADLLRLGGLARKYIKESIDLWLEGSERHDQVINHKDIDEVIKLTGGHPLAAKLVASYLKVKSPEQLLLDTEREAFELKLARHILQSTDQSLLTDLHKLILHILATVRDPITIEDMLAVRELEAYDIDDIHRAKLELTEYFLLEQDGEYISLHGFLLTYFRDQLVELVERRESIAYDVGVHSYRKAIELNTELREKLTDSQTYEDEDEIVRLSNAIFRYAIPASRLLLSVGEDELADELPIQVKGTLREMVFYFYQEKRDYRKALQYAEKWLQFNPEDTEIILYRARCYRNFRDRTSIDKAEQVLAELNPSESSKYYAARIYREKGLVAQAKGRPEEAKKFFRDGIKLDREYPFVGNYVGLAMVLMNEARKKPVGSKDRQALLNEAVGHLKKARKLEIPVFDRFHLGTYIEALIEAGDYDTASQLLDSALKERPRDPRLNYAMAEVLRRAGNVDAAEPFARIAFEHGVQKAPLSLANILHEQGLRLVSNRRDREARSKLQNALTALSRFRPEFGDDEEVADNTRAKIFRALNDYQNARAAVEKYSQTDNPYTVYEQCKVDLSEAQQLEATGRHGDSLDLLQRIEERLGRYSQKRASRSHQLTDRLEEIREDVSRLRSRIEGD